MHVSRTHASLTNTDSSRFNVGFHFISFIRSNDTEFCTHLRIQAYAFSQLDSFGVHMFRL